MARNWLVSNLLPTSFFFSLQYAVQVHNYIPTKSNNICTTPFQQHHNIKPEYRNLYAIFSISYIKPFKDGKIIVQKEYHKILSISWSEMTINQMENIFTSFTLKVY